MSLCSIHNNICNDGREVLRSNFEYKDEYRSAVWCLMRNRKHYAVGWWIQYPRGPPKNARTWPDVVICSSDSEAWDYTLLVNSVIPANLGFGFTLQGGHKPQTGEDWEYGVTKCLYGYMVWLMKDVFAGTGSHLAVPSIGDPILPSSVCLHIRGQWNSSAQVEWGWFNSQCIYDFLFAETQLNTLCFNNFNINAPRNQQTSANLVMSSFDM